MQEEIANTFPRAMPDFAGLLAALAAAKPTELPAWNDEELPQDVATLSYERALSKHARYKAQDAEGIGTAKSKGIQQGCSSADSQSLVSGRLRIDRPSRQSAAVLPRSERDRKCASVTIRMSHAECEQLHERAAEAGLTISAYLRSCTFEADALRAQVKQALAELRSAHASKATSTFENGAQTWGAQESQRRLPEQSSPDQSLSGQSSLLPGSRLSWFRRIMPDLHPARSLVRA